MMIIYLILKRFENHQSMKVVSCLANRKGKAKKWDQRPETRILSHGWEPVPETRDPRRGTQDSEP